MKKILTAGAIILAAASLFAPAQAAAEVKRYATPAAQQEMSKKHQAYQRLKPKVSAIMQKSDAQLNTWWAGLSAAQKDAATLNLIKAFRDTLILMRANIEQEAGQ